MRTSEKTIENICCIFCFDFVMFMGLYYWRHLDGLRRISSFVIYALAFLSLSWLLALSFWADSTPLANENKNIPKKKLLHITFSVFFIRVLYEASLLVLKNLIPFVRFVIFDVLTIAFWVIAYVFLLAGAKKAMKKPVGIVIFVGIAAIAVNILIDVNLCTDYSFISSKYLPESGYMNEYQQNLSYWQGFKMMVTDVLMQLSLFATYAAFVSERSDEQERTLVLRAIIRSSVYTSIYGVLFVALIANGNLLTIKNETTHGSYSSSGEYSSMDIGYDRYRAYSVSSNQRFCYQDEIIIEKDGKVYGKFAAGEHEPYRLFPKEYARRYAVWNYKVDGKPVYLYDSYGISYYENDVHKFVRLDSLDTQAKNKNITYVLETLLKDGNVFSFELGIGYLKKYSPKFIAPYIDRYSNGDFSENELEWLETMGYRKEYIINLAAQYRDN